MMCVTVWMCKNLGNDLPIGHAFDVRTLLSLIELAKLKEPQGFVSLHGPLNDREVLSGEMSYNEAVDMIMDKFSIDRS